MIDFLPIKEFEINLDWNKSNGLVFILATKKYHLQPGLKSTVLFEEASLPIDRKKIKVGDKFVKKIKLSQNYLLEELR